MRIRTERCARTRLRVGRSPSGHPQVRSSVTLSDPTASAVRPMLVRRDREGVVVSLVPEGALLLADDRIELDVTVDAGTRLDLIEPGGTVAFDMREGRAAWSVLVTLGAGAVLTWAGEPFVVAEGADVDRRTRIRLASGARLALRETLVLGRYGEGPGRIRQRLEVADPRGPVLVEDLPLDGATAPGVLGGHRVLSSVLVCGPALPEEPSAHRYDLEGDAVLWRRLGVQAHEAALPDAWGAAVGAAVR